MMNSLGFDRPPEKTRVVVAMSGGVDSSVVASLLHEQGYDVIGVTLQLYDHGMALAKKGACCAGQDIYDARRVAEMRGFPHYVLDYESKFEAQVIDDFVDTYLRGATPIPCVRCNQSVKFHDLLQAARDLGADCMATGHYVQRVINPVTGRAELHRAVDETKDQSYFLFATTPEQLDFLRFPLGGWTKENTRAHAARLGLMTANKPDSQDICFVPNGDYAAVVRARRPHDVRAGEIVHVDGRVLGQHEGVIHYTVGQRKGLGIGGGVSENNDPLYVIRVEADTARVIVGPRAALARSALRISGAVWLLPAGAPQELDVMVKVRSLAKPVPARLTRPDAGDTAVIYFTESQYGIAPGQAAVCYISDQMIGGGWIDSAV